MLTVCILCQSNKKCVNCIAYTDGCCANCVKSLGKLLKVLKKTVITIVKNCKIVPPIGNRKQNSMSRHGNRSYYNSAIKCAICPKLHTFDKSPRLKTSKYQYSDIIIAPPVDNRICNALH